MPSFFSNLQLRWCNLFGDDASVRGLSRKSSESVAITQRLKEINEELIELRRQQEIYSSELCIKQVCSIYDASVWIDSFSLETNISYQCSLYADLKLQIQLKIVKLGEEKTKLLNGISIIPPLLQLTSTP